MTAPVSQVAVNAACARWLADRLERNGYTGDTHTESEFVCRELLGQGLRPVPRPFPLRPDVPTSTAEGRRRARELFEQTRAAGRQAETDNVEEGL